MSKHLKNIGIVSLLTVVSRFLGLARDMLSAAIFSDSLLNSAFLTAFRLPNLFRRLLGEGSLTAAFLPTLQAELHVAGKPGAYRLLNKVASWLALVTTGITALGMLVFRRARTLGPALHHSRLFHLLSHGFHSGVARLSVHYPAAASLLAQHVHLVPKNPAKWYLVTDLSALLFPYLAFVCLAAALNAALNVFQKFTEPALSPIWLNLAMILSLGGAGYHLAHSKLGEMHWLCVGVLIGGFFQVAVPAGALVRDGWRPRWDFAISPQVREIARLMGPGFFGSAIYQVNILVASYLAYSLNDFAATLMFYANRLMELPIGVFAIAVSTVVYPLIAKHAVERKMDAMATDFLKGIRLILIINVPAAVGLALLSLPVTRLIFQHGHFDSAATAQMKPLLALFAVGMPFFSVVNLTVRAFYAMRDTSTPVKVASIDFFVNLALSLILMRRFGVMGLVAASTTAIILQTVLLQRALIRKLPELTLAPLKMSVLKVLAAAATMSVVVEAGWRFVSTRGLSTHWTDATAIFGLIPLGVLVYAAVLWMLRIEGREDLQALWARFRSR